MKAPKRLYKYRPFSNQTLDMLVGEKLFFDHRFALSNPALVSALSKKSFSELADLGLQLLNVDGECCR